MRDRKGIVGFDVPFVPGGRVARELESNLFPVFNIDAGCPEDCFLEHVELVEVDGRDGIIGVQRHEFLYVISVNIRHEGKSGCESKHFK